MVATQATITPAEADEMPRPPINRFVEHLPEVTYFKPAGVPLRALEEIQLTVDELEAIRLKDLEGLEQEEASARMGVARTTFRRILVGARAKIAEALVHGKAIRIGGGTFIPALRHFKCRECGAEFTEPFGSGVRGRDLRCGRCGSQSLFRTDARR